MRITGGVLKGRKITVPGGVIRPAMDKMRESVFAVLGKLDGLSFSDIFSGSGIVAIEAASRGAEYVEAVESDPLKKKTLLENVSISPIRVNCRFMPAELYIKRTKRIFDIIFLDPPFPYKYRAKLLESLGSSFLLQKGSLIALHRPREDEPGIQVQNMELSDRREYGRSIVDFFSITN